LRVIVGGPGRNTKGKKKWLKNHNPGEIVVLEIEGGKGELRAEIGSQGSQTAKVLLGGQRGRRGSR